MATKRGKSFTTPTGFFITGQETEQPEEQPTQEQSSREQMQPTQTDPADGSSYSVPTGYRLVRETKSKRLQLLTTPTIAEGMRAAAIAQGISLNELCTRLFEEYLQGRAADHKQST